MHLLLVAQVYPADFTTARRTLQQVVVKGKQGQMDEL